ncbi:hypothetical protein H3S84_08010 [Bartonella sp. W8098]|uniref:hypothetical protein n=1 Tax=Bartonella TaxID=773 RepID=UPI0018DD9558|nr:MULTISPECIES: hypothetical protein [Bartonella]MBH9988214.1 hypothetical protein [Bartonella apis]MBI0172237.1 hypothetical protein [Bartonella sp. W8151]
MTTTIYIVKSSIISEVQSEIVICRREVENRRTGCDWLSFVPVGIAAINAITGTELPKTDI